MQCRRREARILVVEDDSAFPELMGGVVLRVGYLADWAADGREAHPRVLGRSLTDGAYPIPTEPRREPEDESMDPDDEPSDCSCLTCAVRREGKIPTYIVLNRRPEEKPVPTVEQVAYVVFCVARVLLLGFGAMLTLAVNPTFVH